MPKNFSSHLEARVAPAGHEQNIPGDRYMRLTLVRPVESVGYSKRWECLCDCGKTTIAYQANLRKGHTSSCGCYGKQQAKELNIRHGLSHTRTHNIWLSMKARCDNESNSRYETYGARGIGYSESWTSFDNFLEDMGECPDDSHSIERVDNDAGYSKDNCRWATAKEQARNRTTTRHISHKGRNISLAECVDIAGIPYQRVLARLNRGWSESRALESTDFGPPN